jgi:hypothetical protein
MHRLHPVQPLLKRGCNNTAGLGHRRMFVRLEESRPSDSSPSTYAGCPPRWVSIGISHTLEWGVAEWQLGPARTGVSQSSVCQHGRPLKTEAEFHSHVVLYTSFRLTISNVWYYMSTGHPFPDNNYSTVWRWQQVTCIRVEGTHKPTSAVDQAYQWQMHYIFTSRRFILIILQIRGNAKSVQYLFSTAAGTVVASDFFFFFI